MSEKEHHIVCVSRAAPMHSVGGMQAVAWDVARALAAGGTRVTMLTTRVPGRDREFSVDGVAVVALPGTTPGKYSRAWWSASRSFFELALAESVTAVLSVSAGAFGLLPAKKQLPHVPFVMQAHGTSWDEIVSKWRTRRPLAIASSVRNVWGLARDLGMYDRFDVVVAIGDAVADGLRKAPVSWRLPAHKIMVIQNGIDTGTFRPDVDARWRERNRLAWSEREHVAITACRLHAQKGVAEALRGFAAWAKSEPRARMIVAGDGPERGRLERLTQELGVAGSVKFVGEVDRPRLAGLLAASDAFLFPTLRQEGLPLNVLEALAVGLPVLTSEHLTSLRDVSAHIAFIQPGNTESIAGALAKLGPASAESLLPERFSLANAAAAYRNLLCEHVT